MSSYFTAYPQPKADGPLAQAKCPKPYVLYEISQASSSKSYLT